MTKGDLRARPVFHHQREAIEAHLTVVFAALAVARHLQDAAGTSIKKIVQTLRTHAQRPSRSTVSASPSTPTSPTPPATSSSGSNQVTKRLARVRSGRRTLSAAARRSSRTAS